MLGRRLYHEDYQQKRLSQRDVGLTEVGDSLPLGDNILGLQLSVIRETVTTGSFPSDLSSPTSHNLVDGTRNRAVIRRQEPDNWSDKVRLEHINHLLRPDRLGHGSSGRGGNDVDLDVVSCTFNGQGLGQTDNGRLGGRVVGLTKVAVETDTGSGGDDSSVLLVLEDGPDGFGALYEATSVHGGIPRATETHLVGTLQVNGNDSIPLGGSHSLERLVPQDTGIRNQHMNGSKRIHGSLDDRLPVFCREGSSNSLTTGRLDFLDDLVGAGGGDIVDDDVGAEFAVHVGVGSTETGAGAGDDDGLTLEVYFRIGLGVGFDGL